MPVLQKRLQSWWRHQDLNVSVSSSSGTTSWRRCRRSRSSGKTGSRCPASGSGVPQDFRESICPDAGLRFQRLSDQPGEKSQVVIFDWLVAAAAVAQSVKHSGLKFLSRAATELTWVQFPVAASEGGKNPSRAIYKADIEVSARIGK